MCFEYTLKATRRCLHLYLSPWLQIHRHLVNGLVMVFHAWNMTVVDNYLRSPFLHLVGWEPILWENFLWFSSFVEGKKCGRGEKCGVGGRECGWEEGSLPPTPHFSPPTTHFKPLPVFFSHKWGEPQILFPQNRLSPFFPTNEEKVYCTILHVNRDWNHWNTHVCVFSVGRLMHPHLLEFCDSVLHRWHLIRW